MNSQLLKYNDLLNTFSSIDLENLNQLKLLKRIDSKFVFPIEKLRPLIEKVSNDYLIVEINGNRCFEYITTYFDSPDLKLYLNHQNGRASRFKIRKRNYTVNNRTYLEIKKKNNKGKTIKTRKRVENSFELFDSDIDFINNQLNINADSLVASSKNSFNRITLVSFESQERITIDYNLQFTINGNSKTFENFGIAELKREKQQKKSPFAKALKELKIYPRGFSKYCMGMALLNPDLKQNSFKKNKLFLKKIDHVNLSSS